MVVGTDGTIFAGYTLPRGLDPSLIGTVFADNQIAARLQGAPSGSFIAAEPNRWHRTHLFVAKAE